VSTNELISGGDTTDVCVYKMENGVLGDQFGKGSTQQKKGAKLRHVPPFPFNTPAQLDNQLLVLLNGDGKQLDVWSTKSNQAVIKIQKKGDFAIKEFAA